jgi:Ca2+-binding RTX toxin-like protein
MAANDSVIGGSDTGYKNLDDATKGKLSDLTQSERDFLGINPNDDKNKVDVGRIGTDPDKAALFVRIENPDTHEVKNQIKSNGDNGTIGRVQDGNSNWTVNLPAHVDIQMFGPSEDQNASGTTAYINTLLDGIFPAGDYLDSLHNMIFNAVKNTDGNSAVRVVLPTDNSKGLSNIVIGSLPETNETLAVNMYALKTTNTLVTKDVDTVMLIGPGNVRVSNTEDQQHHVKGTAVSGDSTDQTIKGSAGNDTLIGGGGTDYLGGGEGADRFTFALNGNTVITDFNQGEGDKIVLNRDIIDQLLAGQLTIDVQDTTIGGFSIADINISGNHLILVGLNSADLTADMISFDL